MYKKNNSLGFLDYYLVFYYAIAPFIYLLRALSGDQGLVAMLLRILEPGLLIITLSYCLKHAPLKVSAFALINLTIGLYGFAVAILQLNKVSDLLGGCVHFMVGLMLFIYYSQAKLHPYLFIDNLLSKISRFCLISYSLGVSLIYLLPTIIGIPIYLGLACQILIVVFFYNYHKRRFLSSLLALVLMILSGKRGVITALVVGASITGLMTITTWRLQKNLKGLLMVLSIIGAVSPFISESLVAKYSYNSNKSLDDYSAGRWDEINSAYSAWIDKGENVILGQGFGFNYVYNHSSNKLPEVENYKNVHFSYLNPLIIFGLPVACIYFVNLMLLAAKTNLSLKSHYLRPVYNSYLIYACFVFDLFDEPILWLINGLFYYRLTAPKKALCQV